MEGLEKLELTNLFEKIMSGGLIETLKAMKFQIIEVIFYIFLLELQIYSEFQN